MFVGNRAVKEFSESGCKFVHLSHYFCAGKKYLLHLDCNDHLPFKVVCDPTAFNSWTLKSDTRLTVQPHISSLGTSECTQVFFFQPLPLGDHLPQTHYLPHPPLSHQTSAAPPTFSVVFIFLYLLSLLCTSPNITPGLIFPSVKNHP